MCDKEGAPHSLLMSLLYINLTHPNIKKYKYEVNRDGIFKLLRSPGIDSKDLIPPAYVVWRAGTATLFLLSS
jgi:hypothetical protein